MRKRSRWLLLANRKTSYNNSNSRCKYKLWVRSV